MAGPPRKARVEQMNQTTPTDQVLWRVDERGVAYVTLNRPEIYNAYNGELVAALLVALDQLGREPARLVVISGKGRNFQAGADINWLDTVRRSSPQDNLHASRMTAETIQRLNMLPIPTVALVQGACFGGGTGIIAACDIVIAATMPFFRLQRCASVSPAPLSFRNSTTPLACAKCAATRSPVSASTLKKRIA